MSAAACAAPVVPVLLGLATALLFALGVHFTRLGLRHVDALTATMISIGTSTLLYWLFAPLFVHAWYWLSPAALVFAAIGLFRPAISANMGTASTRLLGPTVSSTLSATSPVFGAAFGVLVLGESLSASLVAGTAGVMLGVVALSWQPVEVRGWPLWALALPVGAAMLRVLANVLAKLGMEELPSPFFAGLVGYSVSFLVAVAHHAHRRRRTGRGQLNAAGIRWLAATGACYALALLCLNSALHCGPLVVVIPVAATTPLFVMLLGAALFGERRVGRRGTVAVLLVVVSVVLITLHR